MSPNSKYIGSVIPQGFSHTWLNNSPSSCGKCKISPVLTMPRSENTHQWGMIYSHTWKHINVFCSVSCFVPLFPPFWMSYLQIYASNYKVIIVRYYCESSRQEAPLACRRRKTQRSQGSGQLLENPFLDGVRRAQTVLATAKRYHEEHEDAKGGHQKRHGHMLSTTMVYDSRKLPIYLITQGITQIGGKTVMKKCREECN